MSEVHEIPSATPPNSTGEAELVATARALAEDEFNRAERFDRKALNLATVVGAFYSLSQIVVFGALGTEDFVPASWNGRLLAIGIVATVGAALSVGASLMVFRTRGEAGGPLDRLQPWLAALRRGEEERVTDQIILTYKTIAETRRASNETRTTWYKRAAFFAYIAVVATAIELAAILIAVT
ncbi:MAG: hypothetical protein M3Y75_11100 [Actinomycetota bacterium]|nr:hypothetical protein [Actinomycetota bacterium]